MTKKVFTLIHKAADDTVVSLKSCYLLQFDGGAVPNPGTCGSGAVLFAPDGTKIWEVGRYIPYGTNNIAEYTGLEIGLALCLREGYLNLKIEGDSKLVIQQVAGSWALKAMGLRENYNRVMALINKMNYVVVRHVYREFNSDADALTNELQGTRMSFERRLA
jgi:ribonuclease HI